MKKVFEFKNQQGQIVIILLLVMVVALAIALSITSRSITEIATSTNTENSTRAFSAAEAGIEKVIQQSPAIGLGTSGSFQLPVFSNQATAKVEWYGDLPKEKTALEFPPYGKESFGKESFAQFWLIDPDLDCSGGSRCYTGDSFEVYFGDPTQDYSVETGKPEDQPAIEVHVIYKQGNVYKSERYFYDSYDRGSNQSRLNNQFCRCEGGHNPPPIKTNNNSTATAFYCKVTVPPDPGTCISSGPETFAGVQLIMARVRMLYTNTSHTVALQPVGGQSLPLQTNIYRSTGTSGNIQRRLEVFRQKDVMPQFLDFVLFSASELDK